MKPSLSPAAAAEFRLASTIEKPGLTFPNHGFVEWATLTLSQARKLHAAGVRALVRKPHPSPVAAAQPSARKKKKKIE